MQYEFETFYVIKRTIVFNLGLTCRDYECQDYKDTVDLRLHMLCYGLCYTQKGCLRNTLRSKDKGEIFSKMSDHLFIQALDTGRHGCIESSRRLLPALGEQQEEEAGMQIRAQVTLRELKQPHICTCIYICPRYIYIHSCLYLYTQGTKQPSEINSHCEGLRKKEREKAFQRECFQNRSSSGASENLP